jgi:hypothetical protein
MDVRSKSNIRGLISVLPVMEPKSSRALKSNNARYAKVQVLRQSDKEILSFK